MLQILNFILVEKIKEIYDFYSFDFVITLKI